MLANVIKSFFLDLKEPLIPPTVRDQFIAVGQIVCMEEKVKGLKELVQQLPDVNRATLGFLIRHFQYVSSCSRSMMPLANMARVFGPILFGSSVPNVRINNQEEYFQLVEAMYGLLSIEPGFFIPFLS